MEPKPCPQGDSSLRLRGVSTPEPCLRAPPSPLGSTPKPCPRVHPRAPPPRRPHPRGPPNPPRLRIRSPHRPGHPQRRQTGAASPEPQHRPPTKTGDSASAPARRYRLAAGLGSHASKLQCTVRRNRNLKPPISLESALQLLQVAIRAGLKPRHRSLRLIRGAELLECILLPLHHASEQACLGISSNTRKIVRDLLGNVRAAAERLEAALGNVPKHASGQLLHPLPALIPERDHVLGHLSHSPLERAALRFATDGRHSARIPIHLIRSHFGWGAGGTVCCEGSCP